VGLPASPAVQCPGLTGTGRHCADEHTDRAARKEPCPPSADDGNAHPPGLDLRLPQSNDGPPTPAAAVSAVTSTAYACGRPCGRRACGRRGRHFRQPPPPSTVVAGTIRRGFRQTPAKSSKALQQNARSSKTLQQNSSKTPAKLQQNAGTAQLQQNAGTAQQNAGTACAAAPSKTRRPAKRWHRLQRAQNAGTQNPAKRWHRLPRWWRGTDLACPGSPPTP